MYNERENPSFLSGEELDEYLAKGWYRMGQSIFTTWFLYIGKGFYSALWLRLDLEGFRFSKGNRKLIRRNEPIFQYEIKDAILDKEKEDLFDKYKVDFRGNIYPSLKKYLFDENDSNIFNTKEVNIYHDGQLVAYSFFDLGGNSLASIQGVYDPDYKRYSLGYYSMLLEIAYGLEHGYQYYYPGYVVPGHSHFDYKARVGKVDYYDTIGEGWLPYGSLDKADIPVEVMKSKLRALQGVFKETGVESNAYFYIYYQETIMAKWEMDFMDQPLFLMHPKKGTPFHFVSTYDLKNKDYRCYLCFISPYLIVNEEFHATLPSIDNHFVPLKGILEIAYTMPPVKTVEEVLLLSTMDV